MITLPVNFAAQVASSSSSLIGEMSPFMVLIIGVLLAGLLLSIIIGALRH